MHLGLGSNLGERRGFLNSACDQLCSGTLSEFRTSAIYESEPLLKMPQPKYLNMVVRGLTQLSPEELMKKCQQIENNLGRIRKERWGSRIIDIDILSYGDKIVNADNLTIPHPEIKNRGFVLLPLLELSPEWKDPKFGTCIKKLWEKWFQSKTSDVPIKLMKM